MSYPYTPNLPECYKMLNVSPDMNWVEIKKSYRALAFKFHPDHHPDNENSEIRFQEISRAFKTLESYYQSFRKEEYEYSFSDHIDPTNIDEVFDSNMEGSSSSHQNLFKSMLRRRVHKELVFSLKDHFVKSLGLLEKKAFHLDVDKEIKIDSSIAGKGGLVKIRQNKESFQVSIPQGAWNRMKIRIPNKGATSWFSKKRGDLLLDVQVLSPNSKVHASETDLYYDFPVLAASIKAGKINTLKTVQGLIKFTLPRNATNGQTFTLKAKPSTDESLRTNHIIKIQLN